jgi:hypothetical protein
MILRDAGGSFKLLVEPPKPIRSRMREEAKNNPRKREL